MARTLIFLLLSWGSTVLAQHALIDGPTGSPYAYRYRLSDSEVRAWLTDSLAFVLPQRSPVDSFPVFEQAPQLPPGYYLVSQALGAQEQRTLYVVHRWQVYLLDNKQDFCVVATDTLGRPLPGAALHFDGRRVPFDPQLQAYCLLHTRRRGILEVTYDGHTDFFSIEDKLGRRSIGSVGRQVLYTPPLRYVWRTPYVFVRDIALSIRYRSASGWLYKVVALLPDPVAKGTVVLNQPKYRPGDTLRYKAFLMRRNGKPARQAVCYLYLDTQPLRLLDSAVAYRPGAFTGQIVLHDSLRLRLDQQYRLLLGARNQRTGPNIQAGFRLSDYELSQVRFTLRSEQKSHVRGEAVRVFARVTDQNDLNLPGSKITLYVLSRTVDEFYGSRVHVPDTLWVHEQKPEPVGETGIVVPDSIFPSASFAYEIVGVLLSASGERLTQQVSIQYSYLPARLALEVRDDSLYAAYQLHGREQSRRGWLTARSHAGYLLRADSVALPLRLGIDPFAAIYTLAVDTLTASLTPDPTPPGLAARRSRDSIYFSIRNPQQLPLYYYLYRGDRLVHRGYGTRLPDALSAHSRQPYGLSLHYVKAGAIASQEYRIDRPGPALTLRIEGPAQAYPGEQVALALHVRDEHDQPVAGADVSAYALTAAFDGYSSPKLAARVGEYRKGRTTYNSFTTKPLSMSAYYPLDYRYWRTRFGLDSLAFYRFTWPDSGIATVLLPAPQGLTQIAPYVVDRGRQMLVHIIAIDEVPVYYSFAQGSGVYSFPVQPGYHRLALRMAAYTVLLDSVYVPEGKKLLLSADLRAFHPHKSVLLADRMLSERERQQIERYLMTIEHVAGDRMAVLVQDNRVFPVPEKRYGVHLLGPVQPGNFTLEVFDAYRISADHEPGYGYTFREGLVKMRSRKPTMPIVLEAASAPSVGEAGAWQASWQRFAPTVATLRPRVPVQLYTNSDALHTLPGYTALHLWLPDSLSILENHLYAHGDSAVFVRQPGLQRVFHQLKTGLYHYRGWLSDSTYYAVDSIWVGAYGRTYIRPQVRIVHADKMTQMAFRRLFTVFHTMEERQQRLRGMSTQYLAASSPVAEGEFTQYVDGYVYNEAGEPLAGTTIVVSGTSVGVLANETGYFELYAPPGAVLIVSYIGYEPQYIPIQPTSLSVRMKESVARLEEVVIVGYGTQKQLSVTSAVVRISPLSKSDLLQGRVAGLDASSLWYNPLSDMYSSAQDVAALQEGMVADQVSDDSMQPTLQASLRTRFRDWAFWQPALHTDAAGVARFEARLPDDVTRWRSFFLAWDPATGRTGQTESSLRTYKPLMAQLSLPRFLVVGDSSSVVGKIQNYADDSMTLRLSLRIGDSLYWARTAPVRYSLVDTIALVAPANTDSLLLTYRLDRPADGYFDGEQRGIALYPQGDLHSEGRFAILAEDSLVAWTFDTRASVDIAVQGTLLELALDELHYVLRYRHACNEQLASKLKALVLMRRIRLHLGQPFRDDEDIRRMIRLLEKTRNEDGLWGWWPGGRSQDWISLHVLEALLDARTAGYDVDIDTLALRDRLLFDLLADTSRVSLHRMMVLHRLGSTAQFDILLDRQQVIRHNIGDQLRIVRLRQLRQLPYTLDSLWHYRQTSLYGGSYWPGRHYGVYGDMLDHTLLAYEILRDAGGHEDELLRIRRWLLQQRQHGHWGHTYASIRVLDVLLPELLRGGELPGPPVLYLSYAGKEDTIRHFPHHQTLPPGSRFTARNSSSLPVFVGGYQQWFDPAATATGTDFRVRRWWGSDTSSIDQTLEAGKPAKLQVALSLARAAEYVMIEVPIPAGCSYAHRRDPRGYGEVHRAYDRDRMLIFCERLPAGTFTYEVELQPRYPGAYTLNPARAEEMYFPMFYGRSGVARIHIE